MKKLHELLKVIPEQWDSMPRNEKIKIIIDCLAEEEWLKFFPFFGIFATNNGLYKQFLGQEKLTEKRKQVENLIEKLKNHNLTDLEKYLFLNQFLNITTTEIRNLLSQHIFPKKELWNSKETKIRIENTLEKLYPIQILHKHFTNLIDVSEKERKMVQLKREEIIAEISEGMFTSIKSDLKKCLREIVTRKIKREFEEDNISIDSLKIFGYDYDKYKRSLFFEYESGFLSIEREIIKNLKYPIINTKKTEALTNKDNEKVLEELREFERKRTDKDKKTLINILTENLRKIEKFNSQFFTDYKNEILPSLHNNSEQEIVSFFALEIDRHFRLTEEEFAKLVLTITYSGRRYKKLKLKYDTLEEEFDEKVKEIQLNSFQNTISKLAEVDGKMITAQEKLKKSLKEADKCKKINHLLHQTSTKKIEDLKNNRKFLIQKAIEMADKLTNQENKTLAKDKEMREYENISDELYDELVAAKNQSQAKISKKNLAINKKQAEISQLKTEKNQTLNTLGLTDFEPTTILAKLGTSKLSDIPLAKTLTDLITDSNWKTNHTFNHSTPHCNLPLHSDYDTCKTESGIYQQIYTELNGKVSTDELEALLGQEDEIKQLKIDKQDLENKLDLKKANKKNLHAQIKELKNSQKEQEQELTTSKEKITNLETEKINWKQEKKQLLTKQNELLAEIELLKNPPLTDSNKEKVKQSTIVKEVIKEILIKGLESNKLGFKLTLSEKTKLNNLSPQEVENYHYQLIKSKFNHLESQTNKQLNAIQRERESKIALNSHFGISNSNYNKISIIN